MERKLLFKEESEFRYRMFLIMKAMNKRLLKKIDLEFWRGLTLDEQRSVLMGLLNSKK